MDWYKTVILILVVARALLLPLARAEPNGTFAISKSAIAFKRRQGQQQGAGHYRQ